MLSVETKDGQVSITKMEGTENRFLILVLLLTRQCF